jgi:hypothetical protein
LGNLEKQTVNAQTDNCIGVEVNVLYLSHQTTLGAKPWFAFDASSTLKYSDRLRLGLSVTHVSTRVMVQKYDPPSLLVIEAIDRAGRFVVGADDVLNQRDADNRIQQEKLFCAMISFYGSSLLLLVRVRIKESCLPQ